MAIIRPAVIAAVERIITAVAAVQVA